MCVIWRVLMRFFYKPGFVKTRRNASYDAHKPRFFDKTSFMNSDLRVWRGMAGQACHYPYNYTSRRVRRGGGSTPSPPWVFVMCMFCVCFGGTPPPLIDDLKKMTLPPPPQRNWMSIGQNFKFRDPPPPPPQKKKKKKKKVSSYPSFKSSPPPSQRKHKNIHKPLVTLKH